MRIAFAQLIIAAILRLSAGALLLGLVLVPHRARGCDAPVFRYVLEQWPAEPCRLIVFHRGPMDAPEGELAKTLVGRCGNPKAPLNVAVTWVDVDHLDDRLLPELGKPWRDKPLPWAVLLYPGSHVKMSPTPPGRPPLTNGGPLSGIDPMAPGGAPVPSLRQPIAWAGPANAGELDRVLESPVRREIARRLMSAASVVWLFIGSGDFRRDGPVLDRLTDQLSRMEKKLSLPGEPPAGASNAGGGLRSELPQRIGFPVVSVRRDDPAEGAFLAMLENAMSPPLPAGEPQVFVFFGKGRVMEGVAAMQMSQQRVKDVCEFMAQYCSCVAKDKLQRMSFQVPLAADWRQIEHPPVQQELQAPFLAAAAAHQPVASPHVAIPRLTNAAKNAIALTAAHSVTLAGPVAGIIDAHGLAAALARTGLVVAAVVTALTVLVMGTGRGKGKRG